jgi:hypothetical protein
MKATPTAIARNSDDVSTASGSNAGDVMMTSSSQKEEVLNTNNILPNKDPPEGRTTAMVAVMRGIDLNIVTAPTQYQALQTKISAGPVRLWF